MYSILHIISMKMAASIPKNLTFFILKHALNKNARSPVSLSISLHFFSTMTPTSLDFYPTTVYDVLVHKFGFPCDFASRFASELSHVRNPERIDSMLSFFKSSGFSNAQLQKILKFRPLVLCRRFEDDIKPKIKGFREEGFSSGDISKIISNSPEILGLSLNKNIIPSLSLLKGLLGSNIAFVRAVRKYPKLLNSNLEGTVVANVEFLKSIGISMERIRIILKHSPRAFTVRSEVMRASAEKAKEMGLTASSVAFVYAIPTIASMSNEAWELKLQAFRDTGFSESEISSMFRKEPLAFCVSAEKMKKITKSLVATGKFDISSIVHYPKSLGYSFEKRYEPRMRVLRILESRNLIEDWPPLHVLCSSTDAKFSERFVRPYLDEVKHLLQARGSSVDCFV